MEKRREKMLICEFVGKAEDEKFVVRVWKGEEPAVAMKVINICNRKLKIAIKDEVETHNVARAVADILEYSEVIGITFIILEYRNMKWEIANNTSLQQIEHMLLKGLCK